MKKARQGWMWLAILLVVFAVISYFAFTPKPRFYPSYVSDSPSPTGVKGFYTYLNKEMNVKRWNHSPEYLPNRQEKQLLIMVEPLNIPDTKEMKEYLDFIKAGNTVLLLKNNPKGMFDIKTVPVDTAGSSDKILKIHNQGNKAFRAKINSFLRIQPKSVDEILLRDKSGPVALKHPIGKGQLIVAVTPEWLMNGNILADDNLPLILGLINGNDVKSVLFDEYLHGGKTATEAIHVYPKWFLLLIFQGMILAILWLWLQGKRFGPIFTPREESVRFSDEGIRAIAAWYLRGRRYHDSIVIQADFVRQLLQERWQIPYSRRWQDLSGSLERKWRSVKPTEIRPFLQGLAAVLEKENISKQEYLLWSGRLDRLQKEVEQG